jgi:hypothetical protein
MNNERHVSADDFAKIATPLAWPIIALIAVWLFYKPLHALIRRLSETLTFKSLTVKALGGQVELTPEYARSVLSELLDDITESTNTLRPEEIELFDRILRANGTKTLAELVPGFTREDKDGNHERLRNLRDQKLIIPRERGRWKPEKHPVVTRYGQLVDRLRFKSSDRIQEFRREAVG